MIQAHKLNGELIYINSELIRFIESRPDTVLTFLDGKIITVQENPEQLLEKILEFKRQCGPIVNSDQRKDGGAWI